MQALVVYESLFDNIAQVAQAIVRGLQRAGFEAHSVPVTSLASTGPVQVDLLPASPVAGVKPPAKEQSRDRVLSDVEMAVFWRATGAIGWPWGGLFRTLALTMQRLDEASA